ncbi:MAG TPA: DUF4129 domain-containing protein [Actinomycetes bacterium]|nr:DUF4129 domain-containing protein [Actinomycetes bacterium]
MAVPGRLALSLVGAIGADVPVDIGRDDARRDALRELAKPIYQEAKPSLAVRAMRWLLERAFKLFELAGSAPGGPFGLLLLAIVVLVVVLVIRFGVGPFARTAAAESVVFADVARTAANHRAAAEAAAAAGDWATAVRERFRAVIRQLEEDGRLDRRPGRTADEAAAEGGRALPGHAAELRAGARIFDEVVYGEHPASAAQDQRLRGLDDAIRAARRTRTTVGAG